jgi:hypothetical protein
VFCIRADRASVATFRLFVLLSARARDVGILIETGHLALGSLAQSGTSPVA